MADQNFRVKRGLEVGIGGTVISALSTGNVGIASTNPTSKLTVTGDILVSGVVTATSFRGDGSQLTGITGGGGGSSLSISTSVVPQFQYLSFVSSASTTILGISTLSQPLVFTPSTGNLGIGTTNPLQKLHVVDAIVVSSASTTGINTLTNAIQTKAYLNQYSIEDVDGFGTRQYISIAKSDTDLFKVNDDFFNTRLVVGAGGSVGIGTTNPRFALDVIGTTNITGNTNIGGNLTVNNVDIAGGLTWQTVGSGNTIYTLGRVGIGTTIPLQSLHVVDAIIVSSASTTGINTLSNAIQTKAYLNQYSIEDVDGFGTRQYISIAKSDTDLFKVNDDFFSTKFVVGAGGSVGVGTTNPRFTLDVIGTTNISGNTNIGGNLTVNNVDVAGALSWKTGIGNTIYTLGRVGIGTTIPLQSLHVVDAIVVSSASTSLSAAAIQTKAYANQYSIEDVDGFGTKQYFSINKSDTDLFKVNDDFFSTKFVVGAGGSVGIGTTNPTSTLHVSGTTELTGVLESVSVGNTIGIAGTNRVILECDALKSTVFTHNLTNGPVGIVSFKNIPVSKNSATTFTILFTQNAAGTGNISTSTGIGTNVFLSPQGVTGFTTTSKVATASTIILSTTPFDVDIVSFIVHYNGSGTNTKINYTVYATNTTGFRYGSVGF